MDTYIKLYVRATKLISQKKKKVYILVGTKETTAKRSGIKINTLPLILAYYFDPKREHFVSKTILDYPEIGNKSDR